MASTSNPDPTIQFLDSSGAGTSCDRSRSMDEILKNMYADGAVARAFPDTSAAADGSNGMPISRQGSLSFGAWNETEHPEQEQQHEPGMTLEAFLAKAGVVTAEEVEMPVMPTPGLEYNADPVASSVQFQVPGLFQPVHAGHGGFGVDPVVFADGVLPLSSVASGSGGIGGGGALFVRRRAKRVTATDEAAMDRVSQQKHRRMIKNRESAARSRERKQAYTSELEAMVVKLEEEKAMLLREEAERTKLRYKQLMEYIIPITVKRKPPRRLQRVNSM